MNGKMHRFVTALLIPPVVYGTYHFTGSIHLATAAGIGTVTNMLINPDLDMAENPTSLMHYPFFLYGKIIKHRNLWSHAPLIGTLGRILYMTFLAFPVWWYGFGHPSIHVNWTFAEWAFIGLCLADMAHWCCDGFGIRKHKENDKPKRKWLGLWLYDQR